MKDSFYLPKGETIMVFSSYSDTENLCSFTFSKLSLQDELLGWALEELNIEKAIRIFKVAKKYKSI